jgi:mRNA interferase RelE/StbE
MQYKVAWSETFKIQLKKFDKSLAKRIIDKVESITKDPFKFVKRLKGTDLYRLRVGNYRVIMSIESGNLIIFVLDVGHRKAIYRKY